MIEIKTLLTIIQLFIMAFGVYFSAKSKLSFSGKKKKINSYLHKLISLVEEINKIEKNFSNEIGLSDIKKQYFKEITGIYTKIDNQKKLIQLKEETLKDKYSWGDIKMIYNKHLFFEEDNFVIKISSSQKIEQFFIRLFAFFGMFIFLYYATRIEKTYGVFESNIFFFAYLLLTIFFTILFTPSIMGIKLAKKIKKQLKS